ncbi:hypothetical protein TWF696_003373 [Orbilia brochopaga]|uniref:Uncharacterized protein n=1 Tax=Orbilia brochopaga TaxID=3140254 RepID=A0AAV9U196_9PEZI
MGTIPAQHFLHRLTHSTQRRRFEWALSGPNHNPLHEHDTGGGSERANGSSDNDDSSPPNSQSEEQDTNGNTGAAEATMPRKVASKVYPIKVVDGLGRHDWASFYCIQGETPPPATGIFTAPYKSRASTEDTHSNYDKEKAAETDTLKATSNEVGKKVRFNDTTQAVSIEKSVPRPDYAGTLPPNIRITCSTKLSPNEINQDVEHVEASDSGSGGEESFSDEAQDEAYDDYDDYDALLSADGSEESSAADQSCPTKANITEIMRRMKGYRQEASISSSSGVEIEYGGIRLKPYTSSLSEDSDSDIQAAPFVSSETGAEEDEPSSCSSPESDDGSSFQMSPEDEEEQDESDLFKNLGSFADALMVNLCVDEPSSPSASSVSLVQKIVDIEAYRHIPLLDYHDVELAEDAAARSFLPVDQKIGRMSFGLHPPKGTVPKRRTSFYDHVKDLDEEALAAYTITQRQKSFSEFCDVGNISVVHLQSTRDAKDYLRSVYAAGIPEGDDVNEELHEAIRKQFNHPPEEDIKDFMRRIDEEEARLAKLHSQKDYFQRQREEEAAAKEKEAEGEKGLKTAFPTTPGWEPVKVGWKSYDGRIVCVEEGIIPRFEVVEEPEFGPALPHYVWSGAKVTDDVHMNHDLAFKVLRVESKWRETPTGAYLKYIDDEEVASNVSDDSNASTSSLDSDITWSSRLLNHRLMLTRNSVHGSNVDLTYDPEELDTPTLDGERNFAKMRFGGLRYRYPNYVRTIRMFNQMSQIVVIPPPVRKEQMPRKPCLKHTTLWWNTRRSRPKKVKKSAAFKLTNEQLAKSGDEHHPRVNGFSMKKNKLFREEMAKDGIFEVLPSARASHTRLARFRKYYPQILQIPRGTRMTTTTSRPKAYLNNHLARFKLGLPALHSGKQGHQIDDVVRSLLHYRDRAAADHMSGKGMKYDFRVFTGGKRRRKRIVRLQEEPAAKIDRTDEQYLLYARLGKKLRVPDTVWEDIEDGEE